MPDQQQQEPTEQEIKAVGDTNVEPAPAESVAEHVRSAFYQGAGVDDLSAASASEVLDDSQATGPATS
jgi:hypothetical protein